MLGTRVCINFLTPYNFRLQRLQHRPTTYLINQIAHLRGTTIDLGSQSPTGISISSQHIHTHYSTLQTVKLLNAQPQRALSPFLKWATTHTNKGRISCTCSVVEGCMGIEQCNQQGTAQPTICVHTHSCLRHACTHTCMNFRLQRPQYRPTTS